jgi:hypothetical protein
MKRTTFGAVIVLAAFTATCILCAAWSSTPQASPAAPAASSDPPLSDTRLTVHTLLREDIFAGFLRGDMKRFARGEKSIEVLMKQRPDQKANLLAWKAGATLFRAVRANEERNER